MGTKVQATGAVFVSHVSYSDFKYLVANLSEKQRQCLRLVLLRKTSKEMAIELGISSHAVDMRLRTAMAALGVSSRAEAAKILEQTENRVDSYCVYGSPDMASIGHVSDQQQHGLGGLAEGAGEFEQSCFPNGERMAKTNCIGDSCQYLRGPDVWDVLCDNFRYEMNEGQSKFIARRILMIFTIVVVSLLSFSSFIFALRLLATWD